ncbi:MAG TPA: DUF4238 domain-containing protein, partial [Mesorhizobium sp.]|nr:DUF4238 domain-containing protein [Mesorhizobium sp.]
MMIPKFDKRNHHYIPQFWLRGFRDSKRQLFARIGNDIRVVSPAKMMQIDWLYTLFDDQWRPSDALEDALSGAEAHQAQLLKRLQAPGYIPTVEDKAQLCAFLGLQSSRHPDVLRRGLSLAREFATLLAGVHGHSAEEFLALVGRYGIHRSEGEYLYERAASRSKEQLAGELADVLALSPQSPHLPVQDAIRAAPQIEAAIANMQLCLLDATPPSAFVLGDTPIPQSDLGQGFSVPLSRSLAVIACPAKSEKRDMTQREATQTEVDAINRGQFDSADLPQSGGPGLILVHDGPCSYGWCGRRSGSRWRSRPQQGLWCRGSVA